MLTPALLVATLLAPVADPTDKVPNSGYTAWAKFKPGSAVTLRFNASKVVTITLVEVKDDWCVTDEVLTLIEDGRPVLGQPERKERVEIRREVPPRELPGRTDPKTGKPEGTFEEGKEKLKVGDAEFECKWCKYKRKVAQPDGKTTILLEGQEWVCDAVPGRLVKLVTKWDGKEGGEMEVVEVVIKK